MKFRPSISEEKYSKFLEFVLKKHGTTHGKANIELEKAIEEYLDNHKREVAWS